MAQLSWVATSHGWRSGRFHIQGNASTGWRLSIEEPSQPEVLGDNGLRVIVPTQLTEPMSLQGCKQAAERYTAALDRSHRVRLHAIRASAAGAGFLGAMALPGAWTFPVAFVLAFVALREGIAIVDLLTGQAHEYGSGTYQ